MLSYMCGLIFSGNTVPNDYLLDTTNQQTLGNTLVFFPNAFSVCTRAGLAAALQDTGNHDWWFGAKLGFGTLRHK